LKGVVVSILQFTSFSQADPKSSNAIQVEGNWKIGLILDLQEKTVNQICTAFTMKRRYFKRKATTSFEGLSSDFNALASVTK